MANGNSGVDSMTKENLKNILTAVRDMIMRNRVAYKDYIGTEDVIEKTVLISGKLSANGESVNAKDAFKGFVEGETYKVTVGDETVDATAQYGTGSFSGCIVIGSSNVMPSNEIPGWMICVYNENLLGYGAGEWVGKSVEVFTERTVKVDRWDVKKLPYKLLPDQLFSDLEEMMEKLSSQIKSLRVDPVFTGSFSQNRKPDTDIGADSHAEGRDTVASKIASHAEGYMTIASEIASHAEGSHTTASKIASHAEGNATTASGAESHAEGANTTASGNGSHAEGNFTTASGAESHAEGSYTTASGNGSHAEGNFTVASADYQHVEGAYNIDDGANGDKLHIVGNGTSLKRSNAHTLDKSGNAWYAGDVYVGSTSGTNRDAGSKKLATEAYVDDTKLVIASPGGKMFKITVDDTGTLSATEVTDTTT